MARWIRARPISGLMRTPTGAQHVGIIGTRENAQRAHGAVWFFLANDPPDSMRTLVVTARSHVTTSSAITHGRRRAAPAQLRTTTTRAARTMSHRVGPMGLRSQHRPERVAGAPAGAARDGPPKRAKRACPGGLWKPRSGFKGRQHAIMYRDEMRPTCRLTARTEDGCGKPNSDQFLRQTAIIRMSAKAL